MNSEIYEFVKNVIDITGPLGSILMLMIVVYQINKNTAAVKDSSYHQVVIALSDIDSRISQDEDVAMIYQNGKSDIKKLNEVENLRFSTLVSNYFNLYERLNYLHNEGLLKDEHWKAWLRCIFEKLNHEGINIWWETNSHLYSIPFRNNIKENCLCGKML